MKRTALKRYTALQKKRKKPRRGEPTSEEKAAIRRQKYAETGGRCLLRLHSRHIKGVLPFDGSVFERWHLVHMKSKRRFGWTEPPNKLTGGCYWCHIVSMHSLGEKPDESVWGER